MPRPTPVRPPWFRVLEAARALGPDDSHRFTSADLARKAGIRGTDDSQANQIASAWLSKFLKWGYVAKSGKVEGSGIRAANGYVLTEKGRACVPTEGRASRLVRLLGAVRELRRVRGTPNEPAALAALFRTADEVDPEGAR